jgi:hypothetical protein
MLEEKQHLSDDILNEDSGENWITEMSNDELISLVKLN